MTIQYNGCVWKGGRLRLEKAKEHYLARLRREWEEDALLASSASPTDVDVLADKKMESSEKPKKDLSSEKKQLRIYFPRLGKVIFEDIIICHFLFFCISFFWIFTFTLPSLLLPLPPSLPPSFFFCH